MRILLLLSTSLCVLFIFGQTKKKIDVDAYYRWKSISSKTISTNGNIVMYKEKAYRGNDTLLIHERNNSFAPIVIGKVDKPNLDYNERFVAYHLVNDYDSVRQLKIKDVPKKEWTKDTVAILVLNSDTTYKFEKSKRYSIGEEGGDWILIEREDDFEIKKEEIKKKKCFLRKNKKEEKDPIKNKGSILTVVSAQDWSAKNIEGVTASAISHFGNSYAYVHSYSFNDSIDSASLYVLNGEKLENVFTIEGEILQPTYNRLGTQIAFKSSADTGEYKKHQLYLFDIQNNKLAIVADTAAQFIKAYQSVDAESSITFSRDDAKLFYNLGLKPIKPAEDSLTKDEMYKLDLWSWSDGKLQPQQLLSAKKDVKALVDVVYYISDNRNVVLKDTAEQSLSFMNHRDSDFALMRDQEKYMKEMTWDFWYFDFYKVSLKTGKKELLLEKFHGWNAYLSPNGESLCYFEPADSNWYAKNLSTNGVVNLTKEIPVKFYSNHHDVAQKIGPEGGVEWMKGQEAILLKSHYDIWLISLTGGEPKRLTNGKENNKMYSYFSFDKEEVFVDASKSLFFKYVNEVDMSEGVAKVENDVITDLISVKAKITGLNKAKNSEDVMYQFMSFEKYPDIYFTDLSFESSKRISEANPQQSDYNWGTVEMIKWKDYRGDSIRGLLYKPENFDPSKKYPMIVYFYERYTQNIHYYYSPKPTASIIYPTEYSSNGYLVFIPDITYEIGKPAQGAYNAIMSGTDYLVRNNAFIDSTKLGLQGQSWGGYQTAQLVTMTTRFKCGMAGAPVSNMFSAYGGMRWGSGLSRTFQYETGQSRIGATIWESPELYIENSPLFHLPKVETPLLIMHNDGDGAVPWYQGIELFNGLRRLGKPTWLLNYNGDEHNLMKDANRMDLSIRMRQFFDYYLLDDAQPEWMEKGIPAVYKGKENRY